jgi:hypothetical protein
VSFILARFDILEGSARRGHHDEALEAYELATLQSLYVSVNAMNSMVSFVVDTLEHHRGILGQTQDEMEVLWSQLEVLYLRPPPSASLSH